MPLLPWEKKKKPAAECFDHLRRLVEIGPETTDEEGDTACFYCKRQLRSWASRQYREEAHDRNCPYVVAKKFVEGQQQTR